jgi:hypothetical protein
MVSERTEGFASGPVGEFEIVAGASIEDSEPPALSLGFTSGIVVEPGGMILEE